MVNMQKSELEPQQVFDFVGYQYDLLNGVVRPTQNRWENPSTENNSAFTEQILPSENFHVSYRSSHCDRKTGDPRQTAHETYSVAPQETLEESQNLWKRRSQFRGLSISTCSGGPKRKMS